MVAQGLAIVFISHKLGEVLRVSHRVAVLRAGKLVAEASTADTTESQLVQWMVGHAVQPPERRPSAGRGAVVCALQGVGTAGHGRDRVQRREPGSARAARSWPSPVFRATGRRCWPNCCAAAATSRRPRDAGR